MIRARIGDAEYPARLFDSQLPNPPPLLVASGPIPERRAVAIVGSREPTQESLRFTREVATALAKEGFVVVSGGAVGVDTAAHLAALAAGGDTWCVLGKGRNHPFPRVNLELFEVIERSENSRMIWPFDDDENQGKPGFKYRNGILVALAESVVVVQAHPKSGSRHAITCAHSQQKPCWVMTSYPGQWAFKGSVLAVEEGRAKPLLSVDQLFRSLEPRGPLYEEGRARRKPGRAKKNASASLFGSPQKQVVRPLVKIDWSDEEKSVFSALSNAPVHVDEIIEKLPLAPGSAVSALLTLSSKDVVVEGPDGFFRRRTVT